MSNKPMETKEIQQIIKEIYRHLLINLFNQIINEI